MKEKTEQNELFYNTHFELKNSGLSNKEIRAEVISRLGISDEHKYRAKLSALGNPKRYGGKYVAIREFMKIHGKSIEANAVPVLEKAAPEIETEIEVPETEWKVSA